MLAKFQFLSLVEAHIFDDVSERIVREWFATLNPENQKLITEWLENLVTLAQDALEIRAYKDERYNDE